MGSRLEKGNDATRKFIDDHTFNDEEGEEYEGSKFGGFSEYFRRKKLKLQNLDAQLRAQSTDKPNIFKGIVAHVNGYTQPSLNDLHTLIVQHGGGFLQYLDGKTQVTHIIASSLTPKKAVEFKRYRIVKPAWIVDSIQAGKVLPWNDYRVVDEGAGQKVLTFDGGKIGSQANIKQRGYKDQTDRSWYTEQLRQRHQHLEQPSAASSQLLTPGASSPIPGPASEAQDEAEASEGYFPDDGVFEGDLDPARNEFEEVLEKGHIDSAKSSFVESRGGLISPGHELNDDLPGARFQETATERRAASGFADDSREEEGRPVALEQALKRKASNDGEGTPSAKKAKTLTAEEHNAILLANPHMRKSSVLNPDFLEQYYRESRLHHLSTWKAELKSHFQVLTAEKTASQTARQKRAPGARRYILHVDFDSFFVAVSLKKHPEYVDKPAVVAHGSGPGSEIASCNYPARKYGVKNGMWMKRALETCPDIKVLPYDFPGYEAASKLFYEAIMDTGGIVQSVSIDEALVDVTSFCISAGGTDGSGIREGSIYREQAKAEEIALGIRDRVKKATGCAVSVGIGGNILLAKVALRKAKPAGQYHVRPDEALEFLGQLEVQDLPGVAYSIGGKLDEIGVQFVKDIRDVAKARLTSVLGAKTGEKMYNYARGIDRTEVGEHVIRKSVSAEVNWGVRFETREQVDEFIESLCGELTRRLLKEGVRGKQLTMKVMRRAADAPLDPPKNLGHGKCDVYNKSVALGVASNAKEVLAKEALSVLRSFGISPGELRGLGVQMTKLEAMKASGPSEGSQPRLQFKAAADTRSAVTAVTARTPCNIKETVAAVPRVVELADGDERRQRLLFQKSEAKGTVGEAEDPVVDDPETPQKQSRVSEGMASLGMASLGMASLGRHQNSPSARPLNTSGTQFILPTQVDAKVLAELPADIRAKLCRPPEGAAAARAETGEESRSVGTPIAALPRASQLDPDILQALPADLRREILAEYDTSPRRRKGDQGVLPQSPRKVRAVGATAKKGGAGTRGRPRGGGKGMHQQLKHAGRDTPTLTQAKFVRGAHEDSEGVGGESGISAEILAALPGDIRAEVLANQRREQLKRRAGLTVMRGLAGTGQGRSSTSDEAESSSKNAAAERVVRVPAKTPRATLTLRRLWRLDELREAISGWVEEFGVEGPYAEDVEALCRYLRSVICDEGNLDKAACVVRWFDWEVSRAEGARDRQAHATAGGWSAALAGATAAMQAAARSRGLSL